MHFIADETYCRMSFIWGMVQVEKRGKIMSIPISVSLTFAVRWGSFKVLSYSNLCADNQRFFFVKLEPCVVYAAVVVK